MAVWDPRTYLQFADERSRPFYDLIERVRATEPRVVVDLGCGPGQLTASLADRWPGATVQGFDSSAAMIERADEHTSGRVSFAVCDVGEWQPDRAVDVLVSNATLQWVPRHGDLLGHFVNALSPTGWLAFQVPGNLSQPSHRLLHELATDPRFIEATRGGDEHAAFDAATYLQDLAALGCEVDAWETTYLHVLSGPDPVYRWIAGTGARPILQALSNEQRPEFIPEYQALLRAAYPARDFGTVLPFRRVFVVARRNDAVATHATVDAAQE